MDFSRMSDQELIRIFQTQPPLQGGNDALEVLLGRYQGSAVVMVRHRWILIPKGYDQEQFFQDVISDVWYKLRKYLESSRRPVESFRGLLETTVERAALDERRRIIREGKKVVVVDPRPGVEEEPSLEQAINAAAFRSRFYCPSPHRVLELKDRTKVICAALELLAQEDEQGVKKAHALKLHYLEGWTLGRVAHRCSRSVRQVQRWIDDGLVDLKRIFASRFQINSLMDLL